MRTLAYVLSLELRKLFAYRVHFWVMFVVSVVTEITVAYFLWRAIFTTQGATLMGGFSLLGMVYYYFFIAFAVRIIRGPEMGVISQDIYDGSLTRYLLYPVSFFGYKMMGIIAQQLIATFQLVLCLGVFVALAGMPAEQKITLGSVLAGLAASFLAGGLHFLMVSALEMVSFWQDTVWNLLVMLRFITNLMGGAMIPLAFFPEWGRRVVAFTPFPYLMSFPIRTFLGQVSVAEWLRSVALLGLWAGVFGMLVAWIWARGTRRYAGVGI